MHPQDNPNFVQNPTPQPEPTVKESLTVAVEPEPVIKESLTTESNCPEILDSSNSSVEAGELERCEATEAPEPRKRVLYLAGPMRGVAWFNYPMFDRVAKELRDAGNEVISPADEDRKHDGFDPYANPSHANPDACTFPKTMDFAKTVRRCLEAVLRCDEIVLLPGWENSNGAVAELTLAMWLGKRVRHLNIDDDNRLTFACYWTSLIRLAAQLSEHHMPNVERMGLAEQDDDEDILAEASRITRGSRQAQYGPPDQDFRRTAGMWSALFGLKLKDGVTFEPRDVALAMILLKTSRETHQRKRDNWVDIAGYASCGSRCN
jgi:nucleoside 2-deoxyribosyltransferase